MINAGMFLPTYSCKTIYDFDYSKFFKEGKRYLIFDLDNTLVTYSESRANLEIIEFVNKLKAIGYEVAIVSNSPGFRVKPFLHDFNVIGAYSSKKPFLRKTRNILKSFNNPSLGKCLFIGDQLLTDVLVANRLGLDVLLVDPLEKSTEKWYTKINRFTERFFARRAKKKFPVKYSEVLERRYG